MLSTLKEEITGSKGAIGIFNEAAADNDAPEMAGGCPSERILSARVSARHAELLIPGA